MKTLLSLLAEIGISLFLIAGGFILGVWLSVAKVQKEALDHGAAYRDATGMLQGSIGINGHE